MILSLNKRKYVDEIFSYQIRTYETALKKEYQEMLGTIFAQFFIYLQKKERLKFSAEDIVELQSVVRKETLKFIGNNLGQELLSSDEKLVAGNFDNNTDHILLAYKFAILSFHLKKSVLKKVTYESLVKNHKNNDIKLSEADKHLIDYFKIQIKADILNIQTKMNSEIAEYMHSYNSTEGKKIEKSGSKLNRFLAQLKEKAKKWYDNFQDSIHTTMHSVFDRGRAEQILKENKDALVRKRVSATACNICKKLYLDESGTPKIFTLSELIKNGSNRGKKVNDWLPVIGPVHSNCRCVIEKI